VQGITLPLHFDIYIYTSSTISAYVQLPSATLRVTFKSSPERNAAASLARRQELNEAFTQKLNLLDTNLISV
jgi:hypothetical protein